MALDRSTPLTTAAIRVAAAGLGAAVAGPLGGALGGVIGNTLGPSAAKLVSAYTDKFGEEAAKKLLDTGSDSLLVKLKPSAPDLESAYRQALRISLSQVHSRIPALGEPGFDDWFSNWDVCLTASVSLSLEEIHPAKLAPEDLDTLFRHTMERLDAQGNAIQRRSPSLLLQTRPVPPQLLARLSNHLSACFEENFRAVIVQADYEQAWKQAEFIFRDSIATALARIDERTSVLPKVAEDTAATRADVAAMRRMFQEFYDSARKEGRIPDQDLRAKDDEITRLTGELRKLQEQVAVRSSEPAEAQLSKLLKAGDLNGALRLKSQQVQARREESARDLYELGTIHELRFEWPQALTAYREAWESGKDPDHGFKYAHLAQKLNRFKEAISTYEALLNIYTESRERLTLNNLAAVLYLSDVAMTLNNLAIAYRDTQQIRKAEEAYGRALSIYRQLAKTIPEVYLPGVASTLNNLAILFAITQRIQKAEEAYGEALSIRRQLAQANRDDYLPDIAETLNNLASLYRDTQRIQKAEEAYSEAVSIFRQLAEANPDDYLPMVARLLGNLAVLYGDMQRSRKAEEAGSEAVSIFRQLAEANPDAYRPDLANRLDNLAILYADTQRIRKAEEAYREALSIRRQLAEANPDAYRPGLAGTLNSIGTLFRGTGRNEMAEEAYDLALSIRRQLADANPEVYLPRVADTLNNLANLYGDTGRIEKAKDAFGEALSIVRKLADANPDGYLPRVATVLNNVASFYRSVERMKEAETGAREAERILQPLWQANPELHGNTMANILCTNALVSEAGKNPAEESCALARRAFEAAHDPALRQSIQQLIDRLCPNSAS